MDDNLIIFLMSGVSVIVLLYIAISVFISRRKRKKQKEYEEKHPESAKVYFTNKKYSNFPHERYNILYVNNKKPVFFRARNARGKGFFLKSGDNTINFDYFWSDKESKKRSYDNKLSFTGFKVKVKDYSEYNLFYDYKEKTIKFELMTYEEF